VSELPRTDDLPRSDDGLDPARVEEAFTSFAERVRELEAVAGELRAELRSLRAERFERAPRPPDEEDWPDDGAFSGLERAPSPDWVASVSAPLLRPFAVPRIAVESAFLLGVALLAGLADLDPVWIVLVMAAAWALVALSEWTAAAKRSRWRLDEVAAPVDSAGDDDADSTGPWDMPVVEATAVEPADDSESHTEITTPEDQETGDPVDSAGSADTAEPVEAAEPDEPADTAEPVEPADTAEPDEPVEPADTAEPDEADEPEPQPARRGLRLWRRRSAAPDATEPEEQ